MENEVIQVAGRLNIARPSGINHTEMAVLASKETLYTLGPVPPSMTTRVIGKEINLGPICHFIGSLSYRKETDCKDITQGSTIIYTLCALSSKCTVKKGPSHY